MSGDLNVDGMIIVWAFHSTINIYFLMRKQSTCLSPSIIQFPDIHSGTLAVAPQRPIHSQIDVGPTDGMVTRLIAHIYFLTLKNVLMCEKDECDRNKEIALKKKLNKNVLISCLKFLQLTV